MIGMVFKNCFTKIRCSPTDDADRDQLYMLCPCAADRPGYQVHTIPRKELDSKRCRLPFKFEGN